MAPLSDTALRQAFDTLCQTVTDFTDFEWVSFQNGQRLYTSDLLPELSARLDVIGITGDGTYIACWREPANTSLTLPVVWVGSEGTASVFANSFAEFLTLLPYGTAYIGDVLFAYESQREYPSPYRTNFTPIRAQASLAENAQDYSEHQLYVDWLTATAQLAIAPDPAPVMAQAYQAHSSFEQWLGWI